MPKPPHSGSTLYGRYVGERAGERRRGRIRLGLFVFGVLALYVGFVIAALVFLLPTPRSAPPVPVQPPAVLDVPTTYGPPPRG